MAPGSEDVSPSTLVQNYSKLLNDLNYPGIDGQTLVPSASQEEFLRWICEAFPLGAGKEGISLQKEERDLYVIFLLFREDSFRVRLR